MNKLVTQIFTLSFIALVLVGCEAPVDTKMVELRDAILLESEPSKFLTIDVAQKSDLADEPVTIEGCVDLSSAMANTGKQQAVFVIRKILANDHGGSSHDPDNCPFCKKRLAAAPKAAVAFVDEAGTALPYDPATLFGIKQGDQVVVTGTAKFDEGLKLLQVKANSMYIRDEVEAPPAKKQAEEPVELKPGVPVLPAPMPGLPAEEETTDEPDGDSDSESDSDSELDSDSE